VSGWLAAVVLIALALGALWLLGLRGAMLQLAGAAVLFGAAGYAVQGHPGVPGSPRQANSRAAPIPLTPLRHAFYGQFTPSEHWLVISESFARRGSTQDAAGVLRSAVREHPRDPQLWVGLGNALVDHAGVMTPAAELAFTRAAELSPGHPAPLFFMGLALARSGDGAGAVALWRSILADAPANASWRPIVEDAIAALQPSPR
jgi:cytochrome c-type biogenesis protein CcmH